MKIFFVSLISVFFLSHIINAETPDSIYVIISGDTVHIWNTRVHENCGCQFKLNISISNDSIFVTEVDTSNNWANCHCNFDLSSSITGLESGNYFVEVFRYMPLFYPDSMIYIGSTAFTYGGSPVTFGSESFQSDCYFILSVEENEKMPEKFWLEQNYPNPFNPSTKIGWLSLVSGWQTLKVFDVLGREIARLVNEFRDAGSYEVEFNASHLASGIYFYQIKAGGFVETKKMIFLK